MHKVVVSDTSCFIVLSNINELEILKKLYNSIYSTPEVVAEFGKPLPDWVEVQTVANSKNQQVLEIQVDKGEASALALSLQLDADLVILDDIKARKTAEKLGLSITGTLGVIVKAKKKGIIDSVKPIIEKIRKSNFRISDQLMEAVYIEANEEP